MHSYTEPLSALFNINGGMCLKIRRVYDAGEKQPLPASAARTNGAATNGSAPERSPIDVEIEDRDCDGDRDGAPGSPIGLEESDADGLRWTHQPRAGEPYASRITRTRRWRARADDDA